MRLGDSPMDYVVVANANPMPPARGTSGGEDFSVWGEDGFDFGDILDVVNPLQHLPVVSTIYRELTGDTIAPAPRLMGGALFGGIYGAVASLINVIVEDGTGKDIGAHAVALLFGTDGEADPGEPPAGSTAIAEHSKAGDTGAMAASLAAPAAPQQPAKREIGALEDWANAVPAAVPAAAAAAQPAGEEPAADGREPAPGAAPPIEPAAMVPGPWIADRMMRALEQYRELLLERRADTARLDLQT